jgi:hypothetical protein
VMVKLIDDWRSFGPQAPRPKSRARGQGHPTLVPRCVCLRPGQVWVRVLVGRQAVFRHGSWDPPAGNTYQGFCYIWHGLVTK